MPDEQEVMHGWFSGKQARLGGCSEYNTPGGGTMTVSEVTDRPPPGKPTGDFLDMVYIGEVTTWVRIVSTGTNHLPSSY
jgi:hypothetical protein